jgi:hypothetical protein
MKPMSDPNLVVEVNAQTETPTDEDLRLYPDAVDTLKTKVRGIYLEKGGQLGNENAMESLRAFLGNGYEEVQATETEEINIGELAGSPADTQTRLDVVKITIADPDLTERVLRFKKTLPLEDKEKKGKHFPPLRSPKMGHLFNLTGDGEGSGSTLFVSGSKYENEKDPGKMSFYLPKEKFAQLATEALKP